MRGFFLYLVVLAAVFVIFQIIPSYEKSNPPTDKSKEIELPPKVAEIFKRSCYDCHSNETRWPWYADVAPMKWVVRRDVVEGRKALNFSVWNDYPPQKREKLKRSIYRSVNLAMPLPQYLWLNPEARLSQEDKKIVREWASDGKGYMKIEIR